MPQYVHDSDFFAHLLAILRFYRSDKFRSETHSCRQLGDSFDHSVSALSEFLENFVSFVKKLSRFRFYYTSFEARLEFVLNKKVFIYIYQKSFLFSKKYNISKRIISNTVISLFPLQQMLDHLKLISIRLSRVVFLSF